MRESPLRVTARARERCATRAASRTHSSMRPDTSPVATTSIVGWNAMSNTWQSNSKSDGAKSSNDAPPPPPPPAAAIATPTRKSDAPTSAAPHGAPARRRRLHSWQLPGWAYGVYGSGGRVQPAHPYDAVEPRMRPLDDSPRDLVVVLPHANPTPRQLRRPRTSPPPVHKPSCWPISKLSGWVDRSQWECILPLRPTLA